MNTVKTNSVFNGIPTWGLVLITVFFTFIFFMGMPEEFLTIFQSIKGKGLLLLIIYLIYSILIAGIAFVFCRRNPRNIWFVPVLCNIWWIIGASDPVFWENSFWILICCGVILSIIASIIGMQKAKKNA